MMITIHENLVPADKYSLKCPYEMNPIGICVHNTANDAPAKNEIAYMIGNTSTTSYHFAVDDQEVWQGLPIDRNGWHAGDGSNGEGNRNYIAVEICYSKSGGEKFDQAEIKAAAFIAELLKERNWSLGRVRKHQDFSGKYCPHRTLDLGWERFLKIIQAHMEDVMPVMYKGLDLTNQESMKVAVDLWDEVINKNTYVRSDDYRKLLEAIPATDIDNAKAVLGGIRGRITELEGKLGTAQAEVVNREEQVKRLKDEIANFSTQINDLSAKLTVKIGDYEDLAVAKGKQYIELQQALTTIETLKQAQANGEVTLSIADLFKLIWNQKITIKKG